MSVRAPAPPAAHPLQRLGADEIRLAKALLGAAADHARGPVAVAGVLYGLWLRSARPVVSRGVDLGAESRE